MLDIAELERKFDAIRASLTTKDLQEWLDFAEQRELQEKLEQGEGEIVSIKFNTHQVVMVDADFISVQGISKEEQLKSYNYAIAA
jgi:hypothetical protein